VSPSEPVIWPDTPAFGCDPFKNGDVHAIEASWKVLSRRGRQYHLEYAYPVKQSLTLLTCKHVHFGLIHINNSTNELCVSPPVASQRG
jgi:hypothetical protein